MRALAKRLLRGGSWNNEARNARAANRNDNDPNNRNNNIGFRVLLVLRQHSEEVYRLQAGTVQLKGCAGVPSVSPGQCSASAVNLGWRNHQPFRGGW